MIKWKKEIYEFIRLSLLSDIFIGTISLAFLYVVLTNNTIPFLENNKGLLTVLSIAFAIGVFVETSVAKNRDHILNQISLVKDLLMRLEYVGGKDTMKIFNKERISLLNWFSSIEENKFPTHTIKELNADFFSSNLDYKIGNKSTFELKKAIYLIDYKIIMINIWIQKIWEEKKEIEKNQNKRKYAQKLIEKYKNFIIEARKALEELVPEVKKYIEVEFDIRLNNQ